MKKILGFIIIATFIFACNPSESNDENKIPSDTTEIVNNDKKSEEKEEINEDKIYEKADEIIKKTEVINNEIDSILETL